MDLNFFKNNLAKYSDHYDSSSLFDKIKDVAKKAGVNVVYLVLLLYYSTLDKNMPAQDRLTIISALGYFILPLDLIPDIMPGGFVDDGAALAWAVKRVWSSISPSTKSQAKARLTDWFGHISDSDLKIPGLG